MALTNFFVSVVGNEVLSMHDFTTASMHFGTSSTSTDHVELRMMTDDGSAATGLTKQQVKKILEFFEKYLKVLGQIGDGLDVPAG